MEATPARTGDCHARAVRLAGNAGAGLAIAFGCYMVAVATIMDKSAGHGTVSNYELQDRAGTLYRRRGQTGMTESQVLEHLARNGAVGNPAPSLPIGSFKERDAEEEREIAANLLMNAFLALLMALLWWLLTRGAARLLRA